MRVGVAELLILLVALAAFGAAVAFCTVVLARAMARHRDQQPLGPAVAPLRPAGHRHGGPGGRP
ncbi:MAG: hypothetical protein GEV08_20000 [Acidimicrobiia bacterium]|nr:hypothetical protein [Acidimicrobiia bacterium]